MAEDDFHKKSKIARIFNTKGIIESDVPYTIFEKSGIVRRAKESNGLVKVEPLEGGCDVGNGIPVRPTFDSTRRVVRRNAKSKRR